MNTDAATTESNASPRWQPLAAIERRVLGVLIEKAKTTTENYPLSLNALRGGCNQKSNRSPLMQLDEDQIEEALEQLRKVGAAALVQGGARIDRHRHLAYDWFGVNKVELAVLAELLLRGAQTVGELRGRAARMEPIKDLADLRPMLDSLQAKRLILYLSPPGRGAVVTHALYLDRELEKLKREAVAWSPEPSSAGEPAANTANAPVVSIEAPRRPVPSQDRSGNSPNSTQGTETAVLAEGLRQLREEVAAIRREFHAARAEMESATGQLRRELDELNRQLGN
ncbi:MAG: YceH family protein [Planctomycetes bacterium]|nr:YceH family protein [Planctomycetota bacterium]